MHVLQMDRDENPPPFFLRIKRIQLNVCLFELRTEELRTEKLCVYFFS